MFRVDSSLLWTGGAKDVHTVQIVLPMHLALCTSNAVKSRAAASSSLLSSSSSNTTNFVNCQRCRLVLTSLVEAGNCE
jgi:hypothetical protein